MKNRYFSRLLYSLLSLLLIGISLSANAQTPVRNTSLDANKIYKLVNRVNGNVLELGGSNRYASSEPVNLWPYWGGAHQQWRFEAVGAPGDGAYIIRNRNSQHVLTAVTNGRVEQQPYSGSYYQQWIVESGYITVSGVRKYEFRIRVNSPFRQFLRANETVYAGTVGDEESFNTRELWTIADVSAEQRPVYRLVNVLSNKALMVMNPDYPTVVQGTDYGLAGQQWSFSDYSSDGYLTVINRSMGQVLEIGGGGDLTLPGRTANLYDYWGGQNQQWVLLDLNTGNSLTPEQIVTGQTSTGAPLCYIYNRLSGKILEIGGNGSQLTQEGRQANQWYAWGGQNQQWRLEYVSQNRGTNPTATTLTASGAALKKTAASTPMGTLTLYPNPAHTTLSLALTGQGEVSAVHVTDMRGGITTARYRGNGQVDVADLTPGMYMVTVSDGQHTYHHKFIKE